MSHIFYLKIEGGVCSARVTAVYHPYHLAYHVLFEDGYENVFFTDVETGSWIEEDLGETELAYKIGTKLSKIDQGTPRHRIALSWCKAEVAERTVYFGFHFFSDGSDTVYHVYGANRKFLYQFRSDSGKWFVFKDDLLLKNSQYPDAVKIMISVFSELKRSA